MTFPSFALIQNSSFVQYELSMPSLMSSASKPVDFAQWMA